jgi:prepilin-type N-terminal cleavage/methylation domain-containing protein
LGQPKSGFTLVEMMVSTVLLGALLVIVVPTLGWIAHERRAATLHQELLEAAQNVMDRFTAQNWDDITPDAAAELALDEPLVRRTAATLSAEVTSPPDDADAKRVALKIAWTDTRGQPAPPVWLTAWVYRLPMNEVQE